MFITNGFQAFSDYSPSREDLYASTLFDRKSLPSFEPHGRVLVSVNDANWTLDIHSTYESRLLSLALVRYFICRDSGKRTNTQDVEKALSKIAHYGVQVRKFTPIVETPNSFIHDFRFEKSIKPDKCERDIVLETIVLFLKKAYLRTNDIDYSSLRPSNGEGVGYISPNVLYNCYKGKEFLILVVGTALFLTNLPKTLNNFEKLQTVVDCIKVLRDGFKSTSKGFDHIALSTISKLVKNKVNIRPALLIPRADGGYKLIHRPFLSTEKTFEDTRKHIHLAARALNS